MKYNKNIILIVLFLFIFSGCSNVKNDQIIFESSTIENAVRSKLEIPNGLITTDMIQELNYMEIANGELSFHFITQNQGKDENKIVADRNEKIGFPLSFKQEKIGESPAIYWENALLSPVDIDLTGIENLKEVEFVTVFVPSSDTLKQISKMDTVRHLSIYLQKDQTMDLSVISGMKNLEVLDISGGNIENAKNFSKMKNLAQLNLTNGIVLDSWEFLKQMGWIEHLTVPSTFHDLNFIHGEKLNYLDISQTNISDISHIAAMPKLETLNITGLQIENPSYLQNIKNIIQ